MEVIDLRTLAPLDKDTVVESVARTSRVVIVHEDNRRLGVGAEISALIAEEAFVCLDAPIIRVTAPDISAVPFAPPLEKSYMPSTAKIVSALEQVLRVTKVIGKSSWRSSIEKQMGVSHESAVGIDANSW